MKYYCCDERRREVVKLLGSLNGLEYLEVHDSGVANDPMRQLTLFVRFLRAVVPPLTRDNLRIEGGERIPTVTVDWVARADALPGGEPPGLVDGLTPLTHFLVIRTRFYGDFSVYSLRLVGGPGSDQAPAGFDPMLSTLRFSFKVQCDSDFDCHAPLTCPEPPAPAPLLNYLARDYASLRRLMLDRLSVLLPDGPGRNSADPGLTLVELLAYVGDHLSYQQDAIATEAYLGTARRRTSLRRHARLVDYLVHEGCNARTWVQLGASSPGVPVPAGTQLLTRVKDLPERLAPGSDRLQDALAAGAETFETVEDGLLYPAHARMPFHTWGERECCLPKGATGATLAGRFPGLKAGDVLVLIEELGPRSGQAEDADRSHRQAVRLTHVLLDDDPSGGLFADPPDNNPRPVTRIWWGDEDALAFPLCLSAVTDATHGKEYKDQVSAAYGNMLLADHGRSIAAENLGSVPGSRLTAAPAADNLSCKRARGAAIPVRFRPPLSDGPLTQTLPLTRRHLLKLTPTAQILTDLQVRTFSAALQASLQGQGILFRKSPVAVQGGDGTWSLSDGADALRLRLHDGKLEVYEPGGAALAMTAAAPRRARPAITLTATRQGSPRTWRPRPDLLNSAATAEEFVVESEHDGSARLRFGDDFQGKRPDEGTSFQAHYRVGNGAAGNVGQEAIGHLVSNDARLLRASNPLAARGGVDPEDAEAIRRDASEAFRVQERAVTPNDYAEVTERHASVQRTAATFRWTGSWHTVFLSVDRRGGGTVDAAYERRIRNHVERYRMAGYDLEVDGPRYVALEVSMRVCVLPEHFRADVRAALQRVFSRGWLEDGRRAFFHPDNFSFGQAVYLSALYAAAQAVEGVASVVIDTFQRLRKPDAKPLDAGVLDMGRLEIARLDNDPSFPERGVLRLDLGGGK